ncbi:MAG: hypothetical protein EOM83_02840 [Clostridia bacterium]|nr:hypothetical protein [Clostridia bacterium]
MKIWQTHTPIFIQHIFKAGLFLLMGIRKTKIIKMNHEKIYSDLSDVSEVANGEWDDKLLFVSFYPSSSTFGVESAATLNIVMSLFGND